MMNTHTSIRTAVYNDIPTIMRLAEKEYNSFEQSVPFDPVLTEQYILTMINEPNAVFIVITNYAGEPFGFMTGTLDHIDLSTEPSALCGHWFVDNPKQIYGNKNYGLQLISSFEGWARHKKAKKIMIGLRMDPGTRRSYDRTFAQFGYRPNYVYYTKDTK